jgi:ribosome biogenesis protein Tsr3
LQRVFKNGEQLLKVAEACLDEFAKFELEAYILSMQSNYLMEIK